MILNQAALKRQVTVLALLVIIVIAGIYCYATLPRESFPDITIPYVFVTTTYEGVAPEDMEQLITIPVMIYRLIGSYNFIGACAMGSVLMLFCFLAFLIIDRAGGEVG